MFTTRSSIANSHICAHTGKYLQFQVCVNGGKFQEHQVAYVNMADDHRLFQSSLLHLLHGSIVFALYIVVKRSLALRHPPSPFLCSSSSTTPPAGHTRTHINCKCDKRRIERRLT